MRGLPLSTSVPLASQKVLLRQEELRHEGLETAFQQEQHSERLSKVRPGGAAGPGPVSHEAGGRSLEDTD